MLPPDELRAGGRVLLRRYRVGDGAEFYALVKRNADRLAPFFPGIMQFVKRPSDAERYVRERIEEWNRRIAYFYALVCPETGVQIGQVRFKTVDWSAGKSEIAYFIDQDREGTKLMAAALRALVAAGFDHVGLAKIYARVTPANTRSQRVLEACGFVQEGLLRHDFRTMNGELADVLYYGILKEEHVPPLS